MRDMHGRVAGDFIYQGYQLINTSNLMPGMYTLEIKNKDQVQIVKFIKQSF